MAFSDVSITPGSGANITADEVSGVYTQVVKLDGGTSGSSQPVLADASGNLQVNIGAITGGVTLPISAASALPVNASGYTVPISAASNVPVSAVVGSPVYVRISNGSAAVDTLPVSGTVAATQSGTWAVKLTDGTNNAHLTEVSSNWALDVNIVQSVALGGTSAADGSTFTAGTTALTPIGGVFNDSVASVSSGKSGAARITASRAVHVNNRDSSGNEVGTAASPLYVSPATSPNTQPVSGTVTANQGTAGSAYWKVNLGEVGGTAIATVGTGVLQVGISDFSGNAITESNPLYVQSSSKGKTRVSKTVTLAASTTAGVIWTPATGKAVNIWTLIMVVSAGGTCDIFDGASEDSSGSIVASGTWPIGVSVLNFETAPFASAAVNRALQYTSGSGFAAVITAHGFEE